MIECNERHNAQSVWGLTIACMALIQLKDCRLDVHRIAAPPQVNAANAKAPLVFLHEGLGSVAMWHTRSGFWPEQVCAATGRAGVVYSRPGYGDSDPIADVRGAGRHTPHYLHEHAQDTLPALRQALAIERPVLIGHSDGGTIALIHAATHPVSACVVMAPHVMVEDQSIEAITAAREAYLHGNLRERLSRFHRDVDNAFWQWNDIWLSPAFRRFDIRALCRDITCPVLALQGEDDPYGSLQQVDDIKPAGRIERVALPGCAHTPHREASEATMAALTGFLATVP